jgi:SAM (Sterile alpha motif) domain-containing protein
LHGGAYPYPRSSLAQQAFEKGVVDEEGVPISSQARVNAAIRLQQYEPAFRDNRIDAEILPKLTLEDLKDIGVGMVGDRRKLLDAIAVLRVGALLSPVAEQLSVPQGHHPRPNGGS